MSPIVFVQSMFDCDEDQADYILWNRTAWGFGSWSTIIKQLNDYKRRLARGQKRFCDLCANEPDDDRWTCVSCQAALDNIKENL